MSSQLVELAAHQAFPGSENTPSLWAEFLWGFVLLSMGLIYLFGPLWDPQMPPVRNISESLEQVTPSAAPTGVYSMPRQAAGCKREVLHFTLYFLSGGGRMRKKVLPASSCTTAVVGCSLLNLIFSQNSKSLLNHQPSRPLSSLVQELERLQRFGSITTFTYQSTFQRL